MQKFTASLLKFTDNPLWSFHIQIPVSIAEKYIKAGKRRVLCNLNNTITIHAAILCEKNNYYFININLSIRKALRLQVGSDIEVKLELDESKYQMEFPNELKEIFIQDKEAEMVFHKLSPGKQRSLLHMINILKSEDKRIEKAIIISNYLKETNGIIEYKSLQAAFKRGL